MEQRIDFSHVAPDPLRSLLELDRYLYRCGLERTLIDLVKLRASQINGSEYSTDMYARNLLAEGVEPSRLDALPNWRRSSAFSERERAALAWAEALTSVAATHAPDELYQEARRAFSQKELVDLTYVIALVNAWNRLTVAMRVPAGTEIPRRIPPPSRRPAHPSEHITWTTEDQEILH